MSAAVATSSALPPAPHGDIGRWIRVGYAALAGLGLVLAALSLLKIDGAVVAAGSVGVEGSYKTVQHLDGGIVTEILVRDGDHVSAGDVLLRLDATPARASLAITQLRIDDLSVQLARLEAERDGRSRITLPAPLSRSPATPDFERVVRTQTALFEARTKNRADVRKSLSERVDQLGESLKGLDSQLVSRRGELDLTIAELKVIEPLFERGYVSRQRVIPLQRDKVRLEGEVGRLVSEMDRTRSAIAEAKLKIATTETETMQSIVDEMRKVQAALSELEENRLAQSDKLQRIELRAPLSGHVHALAAHTIGGVVQAGSPIMQIIPDRAPLVIETRIPPSSADKVHIGQGATVRFPSFATHATPRIEGTVTQVSPAQVTDSQGHTYFTAEVSVPESELAHLDKGQRLQPGLPAEVFVKTPSRAVLSYLVKPLTDALAHTFRER